MPIFTIFAIVICLTTPKTFGVECMECSLEYIKCNIIHKIIHTRPHLTCLLIKKTMVKLLVQCKFLYILVGYAPFGSMTGRETFVDVNDQTIAAPGPGQYNPLLKNLDRVKGGQSLSNTVRSI